MVELQLEVVDRDSSVGVNSSVHSKAEDIFDRLIRGFDLKCSEERTFFFESILEPEIRDFLGGGVNLEVIVAVDFVFQDLADILDGGDFF